MLSERCASALRLGNHMNDLREQGIRAHTLGAKNK